MIFGIAIGILVLITFILFFTKGIKSGSFQRVNFIVHKATGFLALILSVIHLIIVWPLRLQRPFGMYILGFVMVFLIIIIILAYYLRSKIGKKWKLVHGITGLLVVACLIIHVYLGISSLNEYKEKVNDLVVEQVELDEVKNGEYIGEENVGYIYCKVRVVVQDKQLVSVDILEHRTELGAPAENLTEVMLEEQSNRVDAVSGATNSSKVIMKAVEKALKNGLIK